VGLATGVDPEKEKAEIAELLADLRETQSSSRGSASGWQGSSNATSKAWVTGRSQRD
jgi:hypothetical protein